MVAVGPLNIPMEQIAQLCRRHRVRRLSLFGSALRPDFGPTSDVDLLVEFESGATPGFAFFALQDEFSRLLGRTVDLNTAGFLGKRFRDGVIAEARTLYAAA